MTKSRNHFDGEFGDHTLLKHAVLRAYLRMWAFKLLQRPGAGSRVFFVDGFAGPGKDAAGNPGSPTIACQIAQEVRGALAARRPGARVVIVAVEKEPRHYAMLLKQLGPFRELENDHVYAFEGIIGQHMDDVSALTVDHPTLYFLDPFGPSGLDAATYPKMLSGQHNEIFALFDDIGAARLRGVVHASDEDLKSELARIASNPSLFLEIDEEDQRAIFSEAERREAARSLTEPAAREAITGALGDDSWIKDLERMEPAEARTELLNRFVRKLRVSGAQFVQVIQIRDEAGKRKYSLVHASKSQKAWTTMKTAVSEGLNRDDLSPTMRERIRRDLAPPVDAVVAWLHDRFASQELRWTGKKGEDAGSVRRVLLNETIVFDFQCGEIKNALTARGRLTRKHRTELCSFPPKSTDG